MLAALSGPPQVQRGLVPDVVVGQGAAVPELTALEDQALPVGWDAHLVLDHGLDLGDGVVRRDVQRDGILA
eukprot:7542763-Heterocapsa_arctica.AAC.1